MTATFQTSHLDISYNGWCNHATWEIALWLQNDEGLYNLALECGTYEATVEALNELGVYKTPDGTRYDSPKVNHIQINSEIYDL
jgi:hypothetical protein